MYDRIYVAHRLDDLVDLAKVRLHYFEIGMVDYLRYGFGTVDQQVEQSHVVTLREQLG